MYSIPAIIKLVVFFVLTLIWLWLFSHLGGLWITGESQGYVVIYKAPHVSVITRADMPAENSADNIRLHEAYLDEHVRTILEVREADGFRDIIIVHYVVLALAVLCALGFLRVIRRNRKKRYFKSRMVYDVDKLKF